jgi:hypothetical protein
MSEHRNFVTLTDEQLKQIAGGECTPEQWITMLDNLKQSYETLIDFTSYVIERVAK